MGCMHMNPAVSMGIRMRGMWRRVRAQKQGCYACCPLHLLIHGGDGMSGGAAWKIPEGIPHHFVVFGSAATLPSIRPLEIVRRRDLAQGARGRSVDLWDLAAVGCGHRLGSRELMFSNVKIGGSR